MSVFTLKKLAGHKDIKTTMRYVHLNDDDVREAMETVHGGHNSRRSGGSLVSTEANNSTLSDSPLRDCVELAEGFEPPTL